MRSKGRKQSTRDTFDIANRRLRYEILFRPRSLPVTRRSLLRDIEDRREFHPDRLRPAAGFDGTRHRLVASGVNVNKRFGISPFKPFRFTPIVPAGISFERSHRVAVCIRRRVRQAVIHALGYAGRVGQKRPRFNAYSLVRC